MTAVPDNIKTNIHSLCTNNSSTTNGKGPSLLRFSSVQVLRIQRLKGLVWVL